MWFSLWNLLTILETLLVVERIERRERERKMRSGALEELRMVVVILEQPFALSCTKSVTLATAVEKGKGKGS